MNIEVEKLRIELIKRGLSIQGNKEDLEKRLFEAINEGHWSTSETGILFAKKPPIVTRTLDVFDKGEIFFVDSNL